MCIARVFEWGARAGVECKCVYLVVRVIFLNKIE